MNLKSLLVAFVGVFLGTAAFAQQVEFQGTGKLTMQSDCREFGWGDAGTVFYSATRYRPANVRDNNNQDKLSIFPDFYAMSLTVNGKINNRFKNTPSVTIGSDLFDNIGAVIQVKLIEKTPSRVTASTQSVRMVVEIRNYDGLAGCTAILDAPLFRRPGF